MLYDSILPNVQLQLDYSYSTLMFSKTATSLNIYKGLLWLV